MITQDNIDRILSNTNIDFEHLAERLLAEGAYPEARRPALQRAVEAAMAAYRQATTPQHGSTCVPVPAPIDVARDCFLLTLQREEELDALAQTYRDEGYTIVTHPDRTQLPEFAKDFAVDAIAQRGGEGVLLRVKQDRDDLRADLDLARQLELTNQQPGWRFDLILLGKTEQQRRRSLPREAEPNREQIEQMIAEAETALRHEIPRAALVLAWAGLEASLRRYAQLAGQEVRKDVQPTVLLREVYGIGGFGYEAFEHLETARKLRNEVVQGRIPSTLPADTIQAVINTSRQLLTDTAAMRPLAG